MVRERQIEKIGIVLSGGLARGIAQLAFCTALTDAIGSRRLAFFSGSSIGALNAYALSCGTQRHLLDYYSGLEINSIPGLWRAIRNGLSLNAFKSCEGDNLSAPTYASASRLMPFDLYYFSLNGMPREDLIRVLDLSMAFPVLNGPKLFHGRFYLDGGTAENVPIEPAEYHDLDMVIVVHCYPKYYPPGKYLRPNRVFLDIDCTMELDRSINPFSTDHSSMTKMAEEGERLGWEFAKNVFADFSFDGVRKRAFGFTRDHIARRKEKAAGMLAVVEYANAIFSFKD